MDIGEILKKLGIPPMLAMVIIILAAVIPTAFAIDARYAKSAEITQKLTDIQKNLDGINGEVSNMAGAEQVILAMLASSNKGSVGFTTPAPGAQIDPNAPIPAPAPGSLADISQKLSKTQAELNRLKAINK